jgi:hypothetical protein
VASVRPQVDPVASIAAAPGDGDRAVLLVGGLGAIVAACVLVAWIGARSLGVRQSQ